MKKTDKENIETDIEKLEIEGYRITDVIAGDIRASEEMKYIIDKVVEEKRGSFYSDILYNLTSERFDETEAKNLWYEILHHKYIVSEKLGRNIGIRVAALDYLENIKKIIEMPKFVEESDFRKTLALATNDPLTGLFNRRKFFEELIFRIGNYKATNIKFSVMMLDLDGFKTLNDTQGHHAGDLILQEFAFILKDEAPEGAIVGRYGGDEMVVLLDDTDLNTAREAAEKIRKRIEQEFSEFKITASIGIVEYPSDGKNFDELMAHVDEVLYRAKEFGRNRIAHFMPVDFFYSDGSEITDVSCVGDFNRWNKNYGRMLYNKDAEKWSIRLNLKPGRYAYKFLVNGTRWIPDPKAKEFSDDGFGGMYSIITVEANRI